MGTKQKPNTYDCLASALPDEPYFVLLARDPHFAELVRLWADRRSSDVQCGERPLDDNPKVVEAYATARAGADWRRIRNGAWRKVVP